jgi:hypothetical protein
MQLHVSESFVSMKIRFAPSDLLLETFVGSFVNSTVAEIQN